MTTDNIYPNIYVGFSVQENEAPDGTGGTTADADFINTITDTVYQLERMVGLASDVSGSIGHEARIKRLEDKNSVRFTYSTAPPSSPSNTDIWVDITSEPWTLNDWNGTQWKMMGANAVQIQSTSVDPTAPTNDEVLTYDSSIGKAKWKASPAAVGFANPMTTPNDIIIGGAAGAATRFGTGTTGQYLSVSPTGLSWVTPPFVTLPGGLVPGDVFMYDGTSLVSVHPGTNNQFLKINSSGLPAWGDLPASPPGSAIPAPSGSYIGALLENDGTNWVVVPQGASGQFLKSNGVGFRNSWAAVSSGGGGGFANPMVALGDVIIGNTGGAAARLPLGTNGQVLKVVGTTPAWAADIGFADPMTTIGDIIIRNGSNATVRLGIGSTGQVLTVTGGVPVWAAATGFSNPMTTAGDTILGGASGVATRLVKGANNTILGVDGSGNVVWRTLSAAGILSNPMTTKWDTIMADTGGTPLRLPLGGLGQVLSVVLGGSGNELGWATPPGATGLSNPMTTLYDIIVGGASGTPTRLGIGSNGQVLSVSSGAIIWSTPSSGFADPMTTIGDIIIRNGSNVTARLGIGSTGQVLTVVSGSPAWAAASGGSSVNWARSLAFA